MGGVKNAMSSEDGVENKILTLKYTVSLELNCGVKSGNCVTFLVSNVFLSLSSMFKRLKYVLRSSGRFKCNRALLQHRLLSSIDTILVNLERSFLFIYFHKYRIHMKSRCMSRNLVSTS